ncbi:hypothetical protein GCM10010499_28800 [Streptomyces thermoviolaceus subsp. apingens]|nr:hypothetical protein GCM10010499_28800 [Streptomyces thermoviolaceus subsp. apingens]
MASRTEAGWPIPETVQVHATIDVSSERDFRLGGTRTPGGDPGISSPDLAGNGSSFPARHAPGRVAPFPVRPVQRSQAAHDDQRKEFLPSPRFSGVPLSQKIADHMLSRMAEAAARRVPGTAALPTPHTSEEADNALMLRAANQARVNRGKPGHSPSGPRR